MNRWIAISLVISPLLAGAVMAEAFYAELNKNIRPRGKFVLGGEHFTYRRRLAV